MLGMGKGCQLGMETVADDPSHANTHMQPQYWAAQLLGLVIATLAHSLTGPPTTPTLLGALTPLTSCKAQHFGPALLLLALFSSAWTYVALSAWDSMALALEASCTFYGLAHGAAFAAAAASVQARGVGAALLNPWVGLLALVDTAERGGAGGGSGVSCGVLYVVGPVLGAGVGAVLSWLTSLNGSECVGLRLCWTAWTTTWPQPKHPPRHTHIDPPVSPPSHPPPPPGRKPSSAPSPRPPRSSSRRSASSTSSPRSAPRPRASPPGPWRSP